MACLYASLIVDSAQEAEIYCEKGRIKLNRRWFMPTTVTLAHNNGQEKNFDFDYSGNGYEYEIVEVINCLKAGKKESNLLNLNWSIKLIELLDTIRAECSLFYDSDNKN